MPCLSGKFDLSIGPLINIGVIPAGVLTPSFTKLLDVCQMLKERYGTITTLINQSSSRKELGKRLLEFKGVGPKTVEIFMRDLKRL